MTHRETAPPTWSRLPLAVWWLVAMALVLGAVLSPVGTLTSHGLAEIVAVQHGTSCEEDMACGHEHEHMDEGEATGVAHHSASAEHAQHSADHSHDKAHAPRGALSHPMPRPTHWQAIATPRVERMVPSRLDRPPMAQTHA